MTLQNGEALRLTGLVAMSVLIGTTALAQDGRQEAASPPASFSATAIPGVVAAGTEIELVAADLGRTEGPVAMRDGSMLVSGRNVILRVDASDNVTTFIEDSNSTNAMGWDLHGRLVSVQRARGDEKVGVLYPPDQVTTLADNYQGRPFNALNDLALDKRGGVYFTDTQGIYYLPPGGSVTRIIDEVPRPNGVVLSPDERTLYVHNKDGVYMIAYDVAPDGSISNRRNFARYDSVRVPGHDDPSWDEDNGADGMAVDSEGRVYAATNAGVEVFSPSGDLLGVMPVQWGAENNTNKAIRIWRQDAEVDELYNSLFRELLTYMMEDPRNITGCTHLLFIAKNIERMGDHATNIAEIVHYQVKGAQLPDDRPRGDDPSFTVVDNDMPTNEDRTR